MVRINPLTQTEFNREYYEEHKRAGLDYAISGDWHTAYGRWFCNALNLAGKSILDSGCACGAIAEGLAQAGAIVTGLDICAEMIEIGQSRFRGLNLIHGDAACLPFADQQFDCIHSAQSAEHWKPDMVPVILAEAFRVLRPGGIFWCALDTQELYDRQQRDPQYEDPTHWCIMPLSWWHERGKEAGFVDAEPEIYHRIKHQPGSFIPRYDWDWFCWRKVA